MRHTIFSLMFFFLLISTQAQTVRLVSANYNVTDSSIEVTGGKLAIDSSKLLRSDSANIFLQGDGEEGKLTGPRVTFSLLSGDIPYISIAFDSLPGPGMYTFGVGCLYPKEKEGQRGYTSTKTDTLVTLSEDQVEHKEFTYGLSDIDPYFSLSKKQARLILLLSKLDKEDLVKYKLYKDGKQLHEGEAKGGARRTTKVVLPRDYSDEVKLELFLNVDEEKRVVDFSE